MNEATLMAIFRPRIIALDSSTLNEVSRGYWSNERSQRDKARLFITQLSDLGVYIAFTLTHVSELLRVKSAKDRLTFLASLPMIAWLRPSSGDWFCGSVADLLCRELDAVLHGNQRDWQGIVTAVRPNLWETGVGSDLFDTNDRLWSAMKLVAHHQHKTEKYVASMTRTDPGRLSDLKLRDVMKLPIRGKEHRGAYMRQFVADLRAQLEGHGDKRFEDASGAASEFAKNTLERLAEWDKKGHIPIDCLADLIGLPPECIDLDMTLAQLGALAAYAEQLRIIANKINASPHLTVREVPLDTLPSHALERRLTAIQMKAPRVSGSDLGDGCIAPLLFYADVVQVDKRTHEYINQIARREPRLASLMNKCLPSMAYADIPGELERRGSD